jgi:hypothetical protein
MDIKIIIMTRTIKDIAIPLKTFKLINAGIPAIINAIGANRRKNPGNRPAQVGV